MQTYHTRDEAIGEARENSALCSELQIDPRRYVLRLNRRYAEVPFDYDRLPPGATIVGMLERGGEFLSFTGK